MSIFNQRLPRAVRSLSCSPKRKRKNLKNLPELKYLNVCLSNTKGTGYMRWFSSRSFLYTRESRTRFSCMHFFITLLSLCPSNEELNQLCNSAWLCLNFAAFFFIECSDSVDSYSVQELAACLQEQWVAQASLCLSKLPLICPRLCAWLLPLSFWRTVFNSCCTFLFGLE